MSEEKIKKKLDVQFFFLVGTDFSSSEESSTVKYSECALRNECPQRGLMTMGTQIPIENRS